MLPEAGSLLSIGSSKSAPFFSTIPQIIKGVVPFKRSKYHFSQCYALLSIKRQTLVVKQQHSHIMP